MQESEQGSQTTWQVMEMVSAQHSPDRPGLHPGFDPFIASRSQPNLFVLGMAPITE